ncbi:MAG: hypothetical protein Q8K85_19440 [Hyphomicrobium sp.]|nr:hypothetical protein [Hyphomicrobium sp.]
MGGGITVADAEAQQGQPKQQPKAGQPKQQPNAGQPAPAAAAPGGAKDAKKDEAATKDGEAKKPGADPTLLTQAEIDLLQQLAERRERIENREQELGRRNAMLKAAETRIDQKIGELKALQTTIEGLIKKYDEQQEKKVAGLVKIYENMKPKQAAKIFEELEMDVLLMVAERINSRKLAPIMAAMNAEKAREVTVELSKLRELPEPGTRIGG